tara:strand:- start:2133 stop:2291 length:159 start_codon:yes stop_codon:yes gene_type:complete
MLAIMRSRILELMPRVLTSAAQKTRSAKPVYVNAWMATRVSTLARNVLRTAL